MGPSNYIKYILYCSPGKAFDDSLFPEDPGLVELLGGISWDTGCELDAFEIILSNGRSSSSES